MGKVNFSIRPMRPDEAEECEQILRSLPEWFGIEEAIVRYREDIEEMETFVAIVEEKIAGFLALNRHNEYTGEIHVMAVRKEFHRRGLGRALVDHAIERCRVYGLEYLEVKTLGPSCEWEPYEATRKFYLALGFRPLEENDLWDTNPCLFMVMHLPCRRKADEPAA